MGVAGVASGAGAGVPGGVAGALRGYRLKMWTCVTRRQSSCSCSCASSAARRDSSSASLHALDPDLRHTRKVPSVTSVPETAFAECSY